MPPNNFLANQHIFKRQRHGFELKFLAAERAERYEAASVAIGPARQLGSGRC